MAEVQEVKPRSYPDGTHRTSPHTLTLVKSWSFGTSRVSSAPPGSCASSLESLKCSRTLGHLPPCVAGQFPPSAGQASLQDPNSRQVGQAIDLLAKYVCAEDKGRQWRCTNTFLQHLAVANMEDLVEDIQVCAELEEGKNFWSNMTTIVEDEIAKRRKLEALG